MYLKLNTACLVWKILKLLTFSMAVIQYGFYSPPGCVVDIFYLGRHFEYIKISKFF